MGDGQFANMTSVPRSDGLSAKYIKTTGWSSGRTEVTRRLLQFVQFLILRQIALLLQIFLDDLMTISARTIPFFWQCSISFHVDEQTHSQHIKAASSALQ